VSLCLCGELVSLRPNADDRHHAAGFAELGSVRKETRGIARGAAFDYADVFACQAGILELALVGFDQVEVQFAGWIAVSGRSLVQKKQGIAQVQRVGIEDLLEERVGVGKLRLELGPHLWSHLIAAVPDAWPDGGPQISRVAAEMPTHLTDPLLNDASDRPAPAGMKGTNRAAAHVGHQHWDAVGSFDGEQQVGDVGNEAVARECFRMLSSHNMHDCRMNLLHLNEWPELTILVLSTHAFQEHRAVPLDVGFGVSGREAEVESAAAIAGRDASGSGTEAMHQPRQVGEDWSA
jgi:hypothetical protein